MPLELFKRLCGMCSSDLLMFVINSLTHQRLRSFLTLIGVIIGVGSIVTFIALGDGLKAAVKEQFEQLGSNVIFVAPGTTTSSGTSNIGSEFQGLSNSTIKKIRNIPEIKTVFAPSGDVGIVEFEKQRVRISVIGADLKEVQTLSSIGFFEIGEGRNLVEGDAFSGVIGYNIAHDYFDNEIKVKERLTINGKIFRVVGITKQANTSFGGGPNTNATIFIPEKAFNQTFPESPKVFMLVEARDSSEVNTSAQKIEAVFTQEYGKNQKEFQVLSSEQVLERVGQVLGIIQIFLAGIAAIALVVGGIGIMNTMVMAVMERTVEIGVLKAIGATNGAILSVFILEAGFIGAFGGGVGVIFGYATAFLVGAIATSAGFTISVAVNPWIIAGALVFSMLVGMVSGAYPARRAAHLDPVDALRGRE